MEEEQKYFRQNLGEPDRMISLKNSVYTAEGRLHRLTNVQCRRGVKLKMQMIAACMSLDSIVQYVSTELKLKSKSKAHIKDRHSHGNHDSREDSSHREIQEVPDRSSGPRMQRRRPAGST